MTDDSNPLFQVGRERAIALRWTLRDIKANRSKFSLMDEADLSTLIDLIDLGLIEMRGDEPVLTNAGHAMLD